MGVSGKSIGEGVINPTIYTIITKGTERRLIDRGIKRVFVKIDIKFSGGYLPLHLPFLCGLPTPYGTSYCLDDRGKAL
jgi:hypothetical protein